MSDQTYATHRSFDAVYHVLLPALYLNFVVMATRALWTGTNVGAFTHLLLGLGLAIHWFKTRLYALRVQDRVIRLEERLRMATLLPEDLRARIPELTPNQCVGLRFASDAELPALARQALAENLDAEAIKKRIQIWRPDTFRI